MHLLAVHAAHYATAKTVSIWSLLLQLVVGLGVVLGLIAVVSRFMRGRVGMVRRSTAPLAVLGRQTLGKGVHVAVVRAGADTWLLGVTSHQVTRLGRYVDTPEEGTEFGDDPVATAGFAGAGFRSALGQLKEKTVRRP